MQYSAAVANQAGISFDELAAYITVISSTTRMSAETIGQSLKTMATRMEQIKIGKMFEDDTTTINQVATSLNAVGIEMMKDANTFRPMGDVLDDLGQKWDTLTQKQQNAIAGTIAGVRQVPQFLTLMQNWGQVTEALAIEQDSAGLATQRFGLYLNGLEATMNRSKAAWEGMWQKTISNDAIKGFYNFSAAIANLLNKLGGLVPVIAAVGIAIAGFSATSIGNAIASLWTFATTTIPAAITSLITLGTTAEITGAAVNTAFGIIGIAIAAIYLAISFAANHAAKELEEINSKIAESTTKYDSLRSAQKTLADLGNEYETLRNKQSRTNDEEQKFTDIQNRIHEILPTVSGDYNELGNFVITAGTSMETLNGLIAEQIRLQKVWLDSQIVSGAKAEAEQLIRQVKEQEELNKKLAEYQSISSKGSMVGVSGKGDVGATNLTEANRKLEETQTDLLAANTQVVSSLDAMRAKYIGLTDETLRAGYIAALRETKIEQEQLDYIMKETGSSTIPGVVAPLQTATNQVEQMNVMFGSASEAMGSASGDFDSLAGSILQTTNQFDEGRLSVSEYANTLNDELKSVDMGSMFADNQGAAETFFAELASQSSNVLGQLVSDFDAGKISLTDYADGLASLGGVFETLGGMAQAMGIDVSGILGDITGATDQLAQMQDLNVATQNAYNATLNDSVQFGTDAYNQYMQQIADVYAQSGFVFTDINGKMYQSSSELYAYLTSGVSNFQNFADSAAHTTGGLVSSVTSSIGKMLVALGNAIKGFKVKITFKPFIDNTKKLDVPITIPGLKKPLNISIPGFGVDASTEGGGMESIGNAIAAFGQDLIGPGSTANSGGSGGQAQIVGPNGQMEDTGPDMGTGTAGTGGAYATGKDWDATAYGMGNAAKALDKAAGGAGGVGKAAGGANDELKKMKSLLDLIVDKLKQEANAEKERLKASLASYKTIIDQRKKMLETMKQETDYQDKIAEKEESISKLRNQIAILTLDKSEEATAQRLKLEEDLAKQTKDLGKEQTQHGYDEQKDALDTEYKDYETYINDKVKVIDEYLKQPGQIMGDAMDIANKKSESLYNDLIAWNKKYGSGITADVTAAWNDTYKIMNKYRDESGQLNAQYALAQVGGVEYADVSGGGSNFLQNILAGGAGTPTKMVEPPINPSSSVSQNLFSPTGLPQTSSAGAMGGIVFNIPISVLGGLDKSVLPDLQNIIEAAFSKINDAMLNRGYVRSVSDFATG